jgi:hypothetical protein
MSDDDLFNHLDSILQPLGAVSSLGEEYPSPPLDVLRYHVRNVRLNAVPVFGRALSVVAVVRQPVDLGFSVDQTRRLVERTCMAVNGRFPPWSLRNGLVVCLTIIVLTPEPIGPEDEAILEEALRIRPRLRVVPLGIVRLNLGQEGMAMALARGPDGLFNEPESLVESLSEHFRRYVPLLDIE